MQNSFSSDVYIVYSVACHCQVQVQLRFHAGMIPPDKVPNIFQEVFIKSCCCPSSNEVDSKLCKELNLNMKLNCSSVLPKLSLSMHTSTCGHI